MTIHAPTPHTNRNRSRFAALIALVLGFALVLAPNSAGAEQPPSLPLVGAVPAYDATAAEEEGYWYSRYNLLSLTLQSGNGETFAPPVATIQAAVAMVDSNPHDGDTAVPPVGAAPLRIIYAGGDPHLAAPMDPKNFASLRWVGGDSRVTTLASAWAIVKELEWAKQFHVDSHFGTPDSDFGAQQRFIGMMMALMPKMQVQAWLQQPARFESSLEGEYAMLLALSDGASMYAADRLPHSASNRYHDPATAAMFADAAHKQFQAVLGTHPSTIRELGVGIQALVWYASSTPRPADQLEALLRIAHWGRQLADAPAATPADHAYAVRGLVEAGRTIDSSLLDQAARHVAALQRNYDAAHGVFTSTNSYTADDVGAIMGALNAARLFLGTRIDHAAVQTMFAGFYEGVVNLGGLQLSAPPVGLFKAPFEQEEPAIFLRYPSTPMPPMAGGAHGVAPVLAASTTWDGSSWTVDDTHYDTAGAMHAINEFIWFHNDEVNGFPTVP